MLEIEGLCEYFLESNKGCDWLRRLVQDDSGQQNLDSLIAVQMPSKCLVSNMASGVAYCGACLKGKKINVEWVGLQESCTKYKKGKRRFTKQV